MTQRMLNRMKRVVIRKRQNGSMVEALIGHLQLLTDAAYTGHVVPIDTDTEYGRERLSELIEDTEHGHNRPLQLHEWHGGTPK